MSPVLARRQRIHESVRAMYPAGAHFDVIATAKAVGLIEAERAGLIPRLRRYDERAPE